MLLTWNKDTIRWYLEANAYTGFYGNIAETVKPSLRGCGTLCDMGCGLGLFDFEVAPLMEQIDCVDINGIVLESVRERAAALGIGNIVTHLEDCDRIGGRWDVIYMSFFGSRELDRFLPRCKRLIAVVGVASETEMFPLKDRSYRKNTADKTKSYLDQRHIPYALTCRQFEFGQPFSSLDDARAFIRAYAPDISEREADDFLSARLTKTDSPEYPFFIPRTKSVGIFELDGVLK